MESSTMKMQEQAISSLQRNSSMLNTNLPIDPWLTPPMSNAAASTTLHSLPGLLAHHGRLPGSVGGTHGPICGLGPITFPLLPPTSSSFSFLSAPSSMVRNGGGGLLERGVIKNSSIASLRLRAQEHIDTVRAPVYNCRASPESDWWWVLYLSAHAKHTEDNHTHKQVYVVSGSMFSCLFCSCLSMDSCHWVECS